jgi:hypothetical protein
MHRLTEYRFSIQCVRRQLHSSDHNTVHVLIMYAAPLSLREPLCVRLIQGHYVLYVELLCDDACLLCADVRLFMLNYMYYSWHLRM